MTAICSTMQPWRTTRREAGRRGTAMESWTMTTEKRLRRLITSSTITTAIACRSLQCTGTRTVTTSATTERCARWGRRNIRGTTTITTEETMVITVLRQSTTITTTTRCSSSGTGTMWTISMSVPWATTTTTHSRTNGLRCRDSTLAIRITRHLLTGLLFDGLRLTPSNVSFILSLRILSLS